MVNEEVLLTEYKVAQDEVDRLNRQLWTTAQILIPLSLAGVGILSNLSTHDTKTLTTISLSALGSSLILFGWYRIAKRWLVYQDITQHRMIEIEKELHMWRLRYELYAARKSRGIDVLDGKTKVSPEEKSRFQKISGSLIPKGGSTSTNIQNIVLLMILTWILLVAREIVLIMGFI